MLHMRPSHVSSEKIPGAPGLYFAALKPISPWLPPELRHPQPQPCRGLFDLLDGRLGELVRVDGNGRRQLARAENLDQRLLARGQANFL